MPRTLPILVVAMASLLAGCIDAPVPIAPLGGGPPTSSLAALGVFASPPAAQIPAADVIPYQVVAPLYADDALKRRFLWVPPGTHVTVTDDRWDLPVGAVCVKTFSFPIDARDPASGERLVETRFLVRTERGFVASTYVWDDAQSDAVASGGERDVPVHWIDADGRAREQLYHVPGTSRCQDCHQQRALGMRTAQLDVDGTWDDGSTNQLDHLVARGVLLERPPTPPLRLVDPSDVTQALDARARSYLDVNCGLCHAPEASAAGTHVLLDLGSELPLCRSTSPIDGRTRVLVPGDPDASALVARLVATDPFVRMPRGGSRLPDAHGVALLEDWIAEMPGSCP